jgi:pimeloyl-ACP methyl ester carboxylesterase/transcriptional regulator with XRE-family HTH domain
MCTRNALCTRLAAYTLTVAIHWPVPVATSTVDQTEPLASILQRHRAAAGLSQGELAERAAVSRRCIADLERGARQTPYPATLRRLVDALGLNDCARAALLEAARRPRRAVSHSRPRPLPAEHSTHEDQTPRTVTDPVASPAVVRDRDQLHFKIHYATRSDGARIAYGVAGRGPVLLIPPGFVSHVEWWETAPGVTAFLQPFMEHRTVVLYDRHGCGLSHRERTDFTAEDDFLDIEAVARVFPENKFGLFGESWGAVPAMIYAARHPERVKRLVLYGSGFGAGNTTAPSQPMDRWSAMAALRRADLDLFVKASLMRLIPSGADEETFRSFVRIFRIAATPDMQECLETVRFDPQPVVSEIRAPTLVLHRRDDRASAFAAGERCAQQIKGARFIPLDGDIHFPWLGDWKAVVAPTLEFLLADDSELT